MAAFIFSRVKQCASNLESRAQVRVWLWECDLKAGFPNLGTFDISVKIFFAMRPPVCFRMLSPISGLYPHDARGAPSCCVVTATLSLTSPTFSW